ncbi:MAG: hypothetical protein ATN34_02930 [Epulopiscium sp. Nele67-Bin002]|nr:MAG: hypothetical protein ATN33_08605 [Epulopiscium sp. Nele67-Bin001]OON91996.1 MAG: hypothetical protein ATN34_02930 [Epulopiscium sp. Nele67-Bin002]
MEKKLRKRVIIFSIGIVFIVFFALVVIINGLNYYNIMVVRLDNMMELIINDDNTRGNNNNELEPPQSLQLTPPPLEDAMPLSAEEMLSNSLILSQNPHYYSEYFCVETNEEGSITHLNMNRSLMTLKTKVEELTQQVILSGKTRGIISNYKFEVVNNWIYFIDFTPEWMLVYSFFLNCVEVSILAFIMICILVVIFSKKVVAVIAKGYQTQREFITGVTHELKTPLTIIKGDVEVINLKNGSSMWTKSIIEQINRLNGLIDYMISLTKLEELTEIPKTKFNLSDLLIDSCIFFEGVAMSSYKQIEYTISPNIYYNGDLQNIELLISILLENALKYGEPNSVIHVSLRVIKGKNTIYITNKAANLEIRQYSEWFDRFYRADTSRNSDSKGFGIGLAMARAIVVSHKGKISAESLDGHTATIKVVL